MITGRTNIICTQYIIYTAHLHFIHASRNITVIYFFFHNTLIHATLRCQSPNLVFRSFSDPLAQRIKRSKQSQARLHGTGKICKTKLISFLPRSINLYFDKYIEISDYSRVCNLVRHLTCTKVFI